MAIPYITGGLGIANQQPIQPQGGLYGTLSRLSVSPRESAADTLARVYRRDWEQYRQRFFPIEDELVGSYRSYADRMEARDQALADVGASFGRARAGLQDQLRSRGLALTPEQQANIDSRSQFSQGLAEIEAINRTNRRMDERDDELLLSGVTPKPASALAQRGY